MRIAVDTRFLRADEKPELSGFTKEVYNRLAAQHAEHQFIFFSDVVVDPVAALPQNVTIVTINPPPRNLLSHKWWYDVKLPLALKKNKAELFIGTYGLLSLTTSVRQILVIRDLAFLQKSAYFPGTNFSFYKRYTSDFIKKSTAIVTLSDFVKEELVKRFNVDRKTITTIGSGSEAELQPLDWEEREVMKEQFAEGCEYFVFTGGVHPRFNLLNVLKAFSIFKKWQRTNMKLIVTGSFVPAFQKELEKINSYKYRNEVIVRKDLTQKQQADVVAASYAMIFPSYYEGFAAPVLNAMSCQVPVITYRKSSMNEITADAGLYSDVDKPEDMAEQMKKIFKDEQLRNKLIEAAKRRSQLFSWDITSRLLWQVIEQVVSK